MLTAQTSATGALFRNKTENPTAPVMLGNVELGSQSKLDLAAFLKTSKNSNADYLNLVVENDKKNKIYGRLFRNHNKKNNESADYSGFINCEDGTLRVSGWINLSKDSQQRYIRLVIDPDTNFDEDLPI